MGCGPFASAAIAVIGCARTLGRNHGCPQRRLGCAFAPERGAFGGLLQPLQDFATDANTVTGCALARVQQGKTLFSIEVKVFRTQAQSAPRNLADAPPL